MWLEYFLTMPSIRHLSAYSLPCSFRKRVTVVPLPSREASVTSYSPLPSLTHFQAFASPAFLLTTSTLSATMKAE